MSRSHVSVSITLAQLLLFAAAIVPMQLRGAAGKDIVVNLAKPPKWYGHFSTCMFQTIDDLDRSFSSIAKTRTKLAIVSYLGNSEGFSLSDRIDETVARILAGLPADSAKVIIFNRFLRKDSSYEELYSADTPLKTRLQVTELNGGYITDCATVDVFKRVVELVSSLRSEMKVTWITLNHGSVVLSNKPHLPNELPKQKFVMNGLVQPVCETVENKCIIFDNSTWIKPKTMNAACKANVRFITLQCTGEGFIRAMQGPCERIAFTNGRTSMSKATELKKFFADNVSQFVSATSAQQGLRTVCDKLKETFHGKEHDDLSMLSLGEGRKMQLKDDQCGSITWIS